ncbi:MAG: NAD(P)/FAD-dependent oxidoreductase [Solirubrobacterales bacterium]|nr:NAD(P)/FAD-dependent oxidoreductase [Solirubrobacterales bacterium]MCB8970775.1 NAD(P)/FAD-dependent oxidoreductase [Thermoleophilales bacterium]
MESSAAPTSAVPTSVNGGAPTAPGTPATTGGASYDAIVVGGGHNGLTTGAYLARAGMRTLILERRHILGGACVTEEVWPGARVSRASYVVSMLQPKVVEELQLKRFGYEAHPLDPAYAAMTPDGPIIFHDDSHKTAESIAKFSKKDAAKFVQFEDLLFMAADFVRPMMIRQPPALGSKAPADIASILRDAGRVAGMPQRDVQQLVRIFTMSVGDWLDSLFENDYLKGSIASTGVVGVWAGPYSPGTAYNLLHHALGELDGNVGSWGQVIGGMGAISEAIAASARAHGAEILTDAEVASIDVAPGGGRVSGVTLADGRTFRAPIVASGAHPKTTILDLAGGHNFPDEVREDMEAYRTRGASVKVNMVLSEPPDYTGLGLTEEESKHLLTAGVNYCPSLDYLERAWQDAVRGVPSENPYTELEVPSSIDPSLTDDDRWVATMFTQYGPSRHDQWKDGDRERYGDTCVANMAQFAPNLPDAIVEREVLAPPDLEDIFGLQGGNIFQGEQDMAQMAFMRPAPSLAQYATPLEGLYLCAAGTHPGGGVMAASGHNAAQRILKDEKRKTGLRGRLRRRASA